jgi:hypothetical protein
MEEPTMRKMNRLPHEEASQDDGLGSNEAFPAGSGPTDSDVEGHRAGEGERFAPRLPGTGGDFRRPTSGGEATDDDVEGHRAGDAREFAPRLPGTGGDFRRPTSGGEATDNDVEGHDIS